MHDHHYDWPLKRRPSPMNDLIRASFDRDALTRILEMPEEDFAAAYDMTTFEMSPDAKRVVHGEDYYFFKDNGSQILAVAHLDTVGLPHTRTARYVDTEDGLVVFSRALDDRLGAYVILELLPRLGITCDILLTVGEESGCSTAQFFEPAKDYNWMIEFDRAETDVVMYQYDDAETRDLVRSVGARVDTGSFSDIAYLGHLEVKGFNWGVGYTGDYHGPRAHAFIEDTFSMVEKFVDFHTMYADEYLPHEEDEFGAGWGRGSLALYGGGHWGDEMDDEEIASFRRRWGLSMDGSEDGLDEDEEGDNLIEVDEVDLADLVDDDPPQAVIEAMLVRDCESASEMADRT